MGLGRLGSDQCLHSRRQWQDHDRRQTTSDRSRPSPALHAAAIRRSMLAAAYIISFLGMIILPILLWIYFRRKFALSWKLVLAGALTFIASQVLHIPLVFGMNSLLQTLPLLANAIILGLLAGLFEETARYILFKFILRNTRSWKEGILVGLR